MSEKCGQNNHCKQEILVGNTLFKYQLNQVSENSWDLVATPCNIPTSVYCIGRLTIATYFDNISTIDTGNNNDNGTCCNRRGMFGLF